MKTMSMFHLTTYIIFLTETKIAKAKRVKKEKFSLPTTISSTLGLHPNISIMIYD